MLPMISSTWLDKQEQLEIDAELGDVIWQAVVDGQGEKEPGEGMVIVTVSPA